MGEKMKVFVGGLSVVAVNFFLLYAVVFAGPPKCTSPSCCNYCNMSFDFPQNSCSDVLNALIASGESNSEFSYQSSVQNPPSVYFVHTTVSTCCPPGYNYYEDVYFNLTTSTSSGCSAAYGFSHSRDGSCDLGNDELNLEKLVNGTDLYYDTPPTILSGCEID